MPLNNKLTNYKIFWDINFQDLCISAKWLSTEPYNTFCCYFRILFWEFFFCQPCPWLIIYFVFCLCSKSTIYLRLLPYFVSDHLVFFVLPAFFLNHYFLKLFLHIIKLSTKITSSSSSSSSSSDDDDDDWCRNICMMEDDVFYDFNNNNNCWYCLEVFKKKTTKTSIAHIQSNKMKTAEKGTVKIKSNKNEGGNQSFLSQFLEWLSWNPNRSSSKHKRNYYVIEAVRIL